MSAKIFSNPTQQPIFKCEINSKNNESITLVDPRSTRALVALMDMYAVLGGAASHYGGPAAFAELMSSVHGYMFHQAQKQNKKWNELFHFVNDAGHCENGLYALKANYQIAGLNLNSLKDFRSIKSKLSGHGEVHLFPEGVLLSNGPLGSAFPMTLGLALGEKLNKQNRITFCALSDGACMEGEAKEAFASIPGLAHKGLLSKYILIISDNNTKLSGRIDKDSFSMLPTFESLKTLGWNVIHLESGNDLEKCYHAIETAIEFVEKNPNQPVVIHAKTIKGIGTKKTAESSSGGHGFPLKSPTELSAFIKEIYNNEPYPELFDVWIKELIEVEQKMLASSAKDTGEKIQKGVSSSLIQLKKEGLPIISITSDLPGSTGVAEFRKEFPESSFDVGVAESNMVSTAAGLSKLGYISVVDTFAQFGVTKGALPITMASLSEAPIIGIFSHSGFQDAADGASHQALSYMAMVSSIPNVDVYLLSCSEEAHHLIYQSVKKFHDEKQKGKTPNSKIFFLGRENFPKNYGSLSYELNKAQLIKSNLKQKNVTIVTGGSLVPQALKAAEELEKKNIGYQIINLSCVTNIDISTISASLEKTNHCLITLEDHQLIGGLGQMLTHALKINNVDFKLKSLAVNGHFGQSAYLADELYKKHEINFESAVYAASELVEFPAT